MSMKKLVAILVAVALIAFGVGFASSSLTKDNNDDDAWIKINSKGVDIGGDSFKDGINKLVEKGMKEEMKEDIKNEKIDETKNEKIDNVKEVQVETCSADVNIIPQKREDVKVHFYGEISSKSIPKLKVDKSRSQLKIYEYYENKNNRNTRYSRLKMDIFIPSSYDKDLDIKTVSGDVNIPNMKIEELNVSTVSGDVDLKNVQSSQNQLVTVSGEIELNNCEGDIDAKTTSGNIKSKIHKGNIKAQSISGNIEMVYNKFNYDITTKSISGNTEIKLPSLSEFCVDIQTLSGDMNCDFPLKASKVGKRNIKGEVGNSKNNINVSTTSGDINIESK